MEIVGNTIVALIMVCAVLGAFLSIWDENNEIGKQFIQGVATIGSIFIPIAGIMASAPFLTEFVLSYLAPFYHMIGADPSIAVSTLIANDLGGYQLAVNVAESKENWVMSFFTGFMCGPTIAFSIPVALKMLNKEDHPYLALGVLSGVLAIPFGVLISGLLSVGFEPMIRSMITTRGMADYQLNLSVLIIVKNLTPIIIFCFLIAFGLLYFPKKMINGFIIFGKVLESCLRIIFVFSVVEYFTGFFSKWLGSWGFAPIVADKTDFVRALEISGYIGMMLCGAFPFVCIIKQYFQKPLEIIGKKLNLSSDATAGIFAAAANFLALFTMIKNLTPQDKVKTIAFGVCSAYLFGDHLAFTANFQPSLIVPVMVGKCFAGFLGVYFASKIAIPRMSKYLSTNHNEN